MRPPFPAGFRRYMVCGMRHNQSPSGKVADPAEPTQIGPAGDAVRDLPPAARRALAEAEERRRAAAAAPAAPVEIGGRDGPDPARYGDWEKGGIVSDF